MILKSSVLPDQVFTRTLLLELQSKSRRVSVFAGVLLIICLRPEKNKSFQTSLNLFFSASCQRIPHGQQHSQ
jgi:hypothetical protein